MVRDEVLRACGDPGEVAHAQLAPLAQDGGQRKTGRIRERPRPPRRPLSDRVGQSSSSQRLRLREVEAQKLAGIVAHEVILIGVDVF
jgi:hypothetical protein